MHRVWGKVIWLKLGRSLDRGRVEWTQGSIFRFPGDFLMCKNVFKKGECDGRKEIMLRMQGGLWPMYFSQWLPFHLIPLGISMNSARILWTVIRRSMRIYEFHSLLVEEVWLKMGWVLTLKLALRFIAFGGIHLFTSQIKSLLGLKMPRRIGPFVVLWVNKLCTIILCMEG